MTARRSGNRCDIAGWFIGSGSEPFPLCASTARHQRRHGELRDARPRPRGRRRGGLDQRGSLYVDIAEDEDAPSAFLEYHFESPFGTGRLDIQALRAVRHALADDPEGFMRAIDETLGALEAKVSA